MIFIDVQRKAGYNTNISRCSGVSIKFISRGRLCGDMIKTKNIKIYHIRTLLLTYLAWMPLNLSIAWWFCQIARVPLTQIPYYWGLLHIAFFMLFMPGGSYGFGIPVMALIGLSVLIVGLLIKERWACALIITGMSLWFFGAFCLIGIGA
jgi:hypothetical protein